MVSDGQTRSTREALMDAALDHLNERGVLAGLNLREVAETVGVTPANIYHYFGSRQGLLRAALAREAQRLSAPIEGLESVSFVERRTAMFDLLAARPNLALTALLALDHDPDYQPLPFLAATRAHYQSLAAAGQIPPDLDLDATHTFSLAMSIGFVIYAEAAARQLGVGVDELQARVRAVFERALDGLVGAPGPPSSGG